MKDQDNFLGLGKKAKAKKAAKKSGQGSTTATEALNTYQSVKQKIFGTKATRTAKRAKKKAATNENISDIPVRIKTLMPEKYSVERTVGKELDALSLDDKMDTEANRTHGYINPNPGSVNHADDAINSDLLNENKLLSDVTVSAKSRKNKKDNTMLYIIIGGVALAAFLYFKKK